MRRSNQLIVLTALAVLLTLGSVTYARVTAQAAPEAIFAAKSGEVHLALEVADTPEKQMHGLMGRETMDENTGMIFIFPDTVLVGFWMKDTPLPLSIAFISDQGQIVDILDMDPLTTDVHVPKAPYKYAIEVNQGYYSRHGIATGDSVQINLGTS